MNYYSYTFRLVWSYLKKYPSYFFWMFLRFLYWLGDLFLPILLWWIINDLTQQKYWFQDLGILIVIYCVILLISPFLETYTGYKARDIWWKIWVDFINDFTRKLKNIDISFWENKSKWQVFGALKNSFLSMAQVSIAISHRYMLDIISIIGILLTTIVFLPFVIAIYIIASLLFLLNIKINLKKEKDAQIMENKASENVDASMMEYFNNFSTVLYLNLFHKKEKQIFDKTKNFYYAYKKRLIYSIMYKRLWNHQLNSITMVILFVYLIYSIIKWDILIGTATTIIFFTQKLIEIFCELTDISTNFTKYTADFERFHTLTKEMENTTDIAKYNVWDFQSLKVHNLGVTAENKVLLENINIEIKRWENIAIVWFSGSGKSTLLDVMLKVIKNYKWDIYLGSSPVTD